RAAGPASPDDEKQVREFAYDAGDLADSPKEYDELIAAADKKEPVVPAGLVLPYAGRAHMTQTEVQQLIKSVPPADQFNAKVWVINQRILRPAGAMRTLPWYEPRGPNPYLLVTNQAGTTWEKGHFWDWLLREQLPVLVEPLVKLLEPVIY